MTKTSVSRSELQEIDKKIKSTTWENPLKKIKILIWRTISNTAIKGASSKRLNDTKFKDLLLKLFFYSTYQLYKI